MDEKEALILSYQCLHSAVTTQFCKMLKKLKTIFKKYLTDQSFEDIFIFRLTHLNQMWHKTMQTYINTNYSICLISYFALSVKTLLFLRV